MRKRFDYLTLICFLSILTTNGVAGQIPTWNVTFEPHTVTVHMSESTPINVTITGLDAERLLNDNAVIEFRSDNVIADVDPATVNLKEIVKGTWNGTVELRNTFLGSANIFVVITRNGTEQRSSSSLSAVIIRPQRFIDSLFTVSVACLVSILYINFGAAIDLTKVKGIVMRPIGPLIAMFCQFLFMPVVSHQSEIDLLMVLSLILSCMLFRPATSWDYCSSRIQLKCN